MARSFQEVEQAALALSRDEQELLAYRLLQSGTSADADVDPVWREEIQRRIQAIESGEAELLDGDAVVAELRSFLRDGGL